jgi:hypothetical protein
MTEPMWSARARARIAGRRLVLFGIGMDQIRGFASAGAHVIGGISVLPRGSPTTKASEPFPTLTLTSTTRDILEHVVWGFAQVVERAAPDVGGLLDRVDPEGTANVAGYLPVPHASLGGRAAWIVDSATSLPLERKVGAATALDGVVPVIPARSLPPGRPQEWWDRVCAELDADRLVVQAAGISGGGTGTFVCTSRDEVPVLAQGFVSPFVEGLAGNVMGVVDDTGTTVVFPASRQLIRMDDRRHPLYAGNVTGEPWAEDDREGLGDDVRAIGTALAEIGFFGPFGVDFIRRADGRRQYHDLNPRMNGVVDSLSRLVDRPSTVPLVSVLLSRPQWDPDEALNLEDEVHAAAARSPLARLWLTTTVSRPRVIRTVPRAGRWWIDATAATVTPVGDAPDVPTAWGDQWAATTDRAGGDPQPAGPRPCELQPTLPPGFELHAGDRLALGNLYCDPAFVDEMSESTGPALVDAFLA